jgi:hypothetical protein
MGYCRGSRQPAHCWKPGCRLSLRSARHIGDWRTSSARMGAVIASPVGSQQADRRQCRELQLRTRTAAGCDARQDHARRLEAWLPVGSTRSWELEQSRGNAHCRADVEGDCVGGNEGRAMSSRLIRQLAASARPNRLQILQASAQIGGAGLWPPGAFASPASVLRPICAVARPCGVHPERDARLPQFVRPARACPNTRPWSSAGRGPQIHQGATLKHPGWCRM